MNVDSAILACPPDNSPHFGQNHFGYVMTETPSKARRRFLRFSLRAMMLLVMVISVALGWTIHEARKQGIAVAALEKVGCKIFYDLDSLRFLGRLRGWYGERYLLNVVEVDGEKSQLTDTDLDRIGGLTALHILTLRKARVSDAGLLHLERLKQLAWLNLDGTQVSDAGLVHLHGMTQLRILRLRKTHVTEAGIQELKKALPNCNVRR